MPLSLSNVWIHRATTPSDYVQVDVVAEAESYAAEGERQRRANGRFVTVVMPGVPRDLAFTIDRMSGANFDKLRTFVGVYVYIRDPRGRVIWGTIFGLQGEESLFSDEMLNVQFNLLQSGNQTGEV